MPYDFTHLWNVRKQIKRRKDESKTDLTLENKLVAARRDVGGGLGELGEGDSERTYGDEHRVMYRIAEWLYYTLETNMMPYII